MIKLGECEDILRIIENPDFDPKNLETLKTKKRSRSRSTEKVE